MSKISLRGIFYRRPGGNRFWQYNGVGDRGGGGRQDLLSTTTRGTKVVVPIFLSPPLLFNQLGASLLKRGGTKERRQEDMGRAIE